MDTVNLRSSLDELCINTIRFLSVDAVQQAKSGHPGMPLGAAPMAYVLWTKFLRHHPADPQWFDRDRFVLSAGHGSMLLYSLLHLTGYDLPLEEIKRFRQWGSKTPGHPERGVTPGVEVTTGPLGQGFGDAVGLAIAEAYLAARYNRPGFAVIDHHTYAIASDGDLMEGVASEAASLAGHLKLGKLIVLYDDNRVTLSAGTDLAFTEDRARRFEAYGWHTQIVDDGNDLQAIEDALRSARDETRAPSLILVRTHLGFGSPHKQDSFEAHGSPLGDAEVRATKQNLGWPVDPPFLVPAEASAHFRQALERGAAEQKAWEGHLAAYGEAQPQLAEELQRLIRGEWPLGWDADIPSFAPDAKGIATRVASGKVLNAIAPRLPALIGGSADLDPSTHTALKGLGDFEPEAPRTDEQGSAGGDWGYQGRTLHFGVREHAMGAILNGLAAHGALVPYGSTFLVFCDYMRPPMRLAAMMGLQVVYVFTHDSIALGEDGTTHQPVEQLAGLRSVPGLVVIRPCDANETAIAWRVALESHDKPTALVLSRQNVPTLDRSRMASAEALRKGAYVLFEAQGEAQLILIATGSEVALAVAAAEQLGGQAVRVRVVSMPSWELFEAQPAQYREHVLPQGVTARLAMEAGSPQGWKRYVGERGDVLGVERFGSSAPAEVMMREYGFTVENVCARALRLLQIPGPGK